MKTKKKTTRFVLSLSNGQNAGAAGLKSNFGFKVKMELTDKGEPGSADPIGITVWNAAGGLLFASRRNGTRTVEQTLGGGNLVVR